MAGKGKYGPMQWRRIPAQKYAWVVGSKPHRFGVCRLCLARFKTGDRIREAPGLRLIYQHVTCPKAG